MRHGNHNRKFGREIQQREALLKGLILNIVEKGKIKTTLAKAKELRPYAEKAVTMAKRNTLASRRVLLSRLYNNANAVGILTNEIAPKYKDRIGGYTRITKLGARKSDGAEMAIIEFI